MGHYDEFYLERDPFWASVQVDTRRQQDMQYKDTKGKPNGARYCYLSDIEQSNQIGCRLDALVNLIEAKHDVTKHIEGLQRVVLAQGDKKRIINDLISLRSSAISSGKYTREGWKEKLDFSLLLDALARHYIKLVYISEIDDESGCLHLAHILANLIMLRYQIRTYKYE